MDNKDVIALQEKANQSQEPVAKQLREANAKAAARYHHEELAEAVPVAPERLFPFRFPDGGKHGYLSSMLPGDSAYVSFSELNRPDLDSEMIEITPEGALGSDTEIVAYLTDGTIKVVIIDGHLGVSEEHTLAVAEARVYPIQEQIGPSYRNRHVRLLQKAKSIRLELTSTKMLLSKAVKRIRRTNRDLTKQEDLALDAVASLKAVQTSTAHKWYIGFYAGCIFSGLAYWAVNNTDAISLVQQWIR